MVRPVDGGVAVRARAPEDELGRRAGERFVAPAVRGAGMDPLLVVALLTQPRLGDLQHLLVVGPVRVVAVGAALQDGRVLPEEGPTLLRMAGVAGIVERVLLQQRGRHGAVRVVARRARHLALAERHVGIAQLLRALPEVAGPARVHHSRLGELVAGRDVLHDRVTARARDVARLVAAALPEEAGALRVAREALRIALIDRGGVLLGEGDQSADDLPARIPVGFAGPMAALASHTLPRGARMLEEETSHVGLGECLERRLVTFLAGVCPGVGLGGDGGVGALGGRGSPGGRPSPGGAVPRRRARGEQDSHAYEKDDANASDCVPATTAWPAHA